MLSCQRLSESSFYIFSTSNKLDEQDGSVSSPRHKNVMALKENDTWAFVTCSCEPNCSAERYTDAATNQQRIGIFARSDITSGTELTYDYLMVPIHHERYSEHLRCRCGAPKCRCSVRINSCIVFTSVLLR